MTASQRLYTPELLGLAVELAAWPLLDAGRRAEVRSPTCGSSIAIDIVADGDGVIDSLGMRVRACAVGQASAAIFARHAIGLSMTDIETALGQIQRWLSDGEGQPEWPDIVLIDAARAYPARHGAILLPWKAAMAALSSTPDAG